MKRSLILTLTASFVISCLPGYSKPPMLTGQVAKENVEQLTTEIPWYNNLSQAESAARSQGKLVFWMHMLGNLSGGT